jgi:hypothetical protein
MARQYNYMTEEIFQSLGFTRLDQTAEQTGAPSDWHYYSLEVGPVCLLSCASDELKEGKWFCVIFEGEDMPITEEKDLIDFVKVLRRIWKS